MIEQRPKLAILSSGKCSTAVFGPQTAPKRVQRESPDQKQFRVVVVWLVGGRRKGSIVGSKNAFIVADKLHADSTDGYFTTPLGFSFSQSY